MAVTDGGETSVAGGDAESGRTFGERWPSARSGGRISSPVRDLGEPGETVVEGFDRPPQWRPEAVVQTATGEESEIGSPGGTAYGQIVVPGAESIIETTSLSHLPPPSVLEGPEPWRETKLFDESDVRLGRVPPPELVAREVAESVQSDRRVTAKEWRSNWYAARFERSGESDSDGEPQLASGISRSTVERVRELVRTGGIASVPSVLGRLGIDPSKKEMVKSVVESATASDSPGP